MSDTIGAESPARKPAATKKAASRKSKPKALPYSSALQELTVEVSNGVLTALNKEAEAQSRGKRFDKLTPSDILTALIYDMGTGPVIKKDEKTQASFTLPTAAVRLIEAAAKEKGVSVDRYIEEMTRQMLK